MDYALVFLLGALAGWVVAKIQSIEPVERTQVDAAGSYAVKVVGESHYQDALLEICGGRTDDGHEKHVTAQLVLEDENPYDPNAVRVDIQGKTVGHLSREAAVAYREWLDDNGHGHVTAECQAVIRGGWDRNGDIGNFGVILDLPA